MAQTKIDWCDCVWNVITGCTPISEGCNNCYAAKMAKRLAGRYGYPKDNPFAVTFHKDRIAEITKWKNKKVFVGSMGDIFHEDVPKEWLDELFRMLIGWDKNIYLILTKRPERMLEYLSGEIPCEPRENGLFKAAGPWRGDIHRHIWAGVTAENQEQADKRIPILLQIPAAVRFVSCEPLLEQLDLRRYLGASWKCPHCGFEQRTDCAVCCNCYERTWPLPINSIDWTIAGGETGHKARPAHPDWFRSLKDQCNNAGVPFFFKSWGEFAPCRFSKKIEHKIWHYEMDDGTTFDAGSYGMPHSGGMIKVGKKKAGRLLDRIEHNDFPGGTQ